MKASCWLGYDNKLKWELAGEFSSTGNILE